MKKIRMHKSFVPDKLELKDILKTKKVSNGKNVKALEDKLKKVHNCKHAICFGSATAATSALFFMLREMKREKSLFNSNLKVVMPSFTWYSTKLVLKMLDIKPKYVDIHPQMYVPDEYQLKDEGKTDYYYLTSTFGQIPVTPDWKKTIVDGAANAGFFDMKKHPALATIVSFSPSKTITGIEGGAVLTNDNYIAEGLLSCRDFYSRMEEINAKIALFNLNRRKEIRNVKKMFREFYEVELDGIATFPIIDDEHALNEIVCELDFNEKQWEELNKVMEVRKRYDTRNCEDTPIANNIYKRIITLPSYLDADIPKICKIIKNISKVYK